MFFPLFIGLVVAIPIVVSLGEHVSSQVGRMRRFMLASVGTCSLSLGVLFGTLFFSSILNAQDEKPQAVHLAGQAVRNLGASDQGEEQSGETEKQSERTAAASKSHRIEFEEIVRTTSGEDALPEWIAAGPKREGDNEHAEPVASEFCESQPAAYHDLDERIKQATNNYIDWSLAHKGAFKHVHFSLDEIKRRCLKTKRPILEEREYRPTTKFRQELAKIDSDGLSKSYRTHALLVFKPAFRQDVKHQWDDFVARSRLWQMGMAGGGIFLVLLTFFGYFSMDNATRGFYTGRLQFLLALAILALIGAGLYFANLIPWV